MKRTEVEQARVAFELSEVRYRIGAEDLMTVLDTQRALSDADTALGQLKLQRLQATVTLYKALGGGWREDPTEKPDLAPLPSEGGAVTYPVKAR